jgi:hypothetical protein
MIDLHCSTSYNNTGVQDFPHFIPLRVDTPRLAASSSYRRKPVSRGPDWIPCQARNDGPEQKTIPRSLLRGSSLTWSCDSFRRLYDRHIPGWIDDLFSLRYAISIPKSEIWEAHIEAKARLIEEVHRRIGMSLKPDVLTIGFARCVVCRYATSERPRHKLRGRSLLCEYRIMGRP